MKKFSLKLLMIGVMILILGLILIPMLPGNSNGSETVEQGSIEVYDLR